MAQNNGIRSSVHIGCCCKIEESEQAFAAGFDYLECPVVSLMPEETGEEQDAEQEDAFEAILARFRGADLPVRAFNIFLPGSLQVVGPDVDRTRVERYVTKALERVRRVGADLVVFGSGRARWRPEDFAHAAAQDQLVDFLQMAGEVAAQQRLTIAIEPLNRRESNMINSVAEAGELAARVNHKAVRILADLYHMQEEDEPLDTVLDWAEWLAHIHVADSERGAPGTGSYPYGAFFQHLHAAPYDHTDPPRVSIECRWQQFSAEAPIAIETLRSNWVAALNPSSST